MGTRRILTTITAIAAVAIGAAGVSTSASARPGTTSSPNCARPVVLVHDIASTTASMEPLRRALGRAGECSVSVEYGSTPLAQTLHRAGGPRLGALTSLEQSGAELVRWFRSDAAPTGPLTVVAHGAGALAVQYALQHGIGADRVRAVVTVGPLWNGTNIGALGDVEQISRRIGTFDTILRLERPVVDPFCAGCREIVTGSDFLVDLRRGTFPTPGVRYADIVSRTDGLVSDPGRSTAAGATVDVLQAVNPRSTSDHFGLPADRLVASLVVARVRG